MKDTLMVVTMLGLGAALGASGAIPEGLQPHGLTTVILYALVFQVGLGLGSNGKLKDMLRCMKGARLWPFALYLAALSAALLLLRLLF